MRSCKECSVLFLEQEEEGGEKGVCVALRVPRTLMSVTALDLDDFLMKGAGTGSGQAPAWPLGGQGGRDPKPREREVNI